MNRTPGIFYKIMCCLLLCATVIFSGCDNSEQESGTSGITVSGLAPIDISGEIIPINDAAADAAELSDYPIIINNTAITEKPETAICLSSSLTEIIYELGYSDRLIGRGSYCEYPEQVKSLTDFGRPSAPDLDAIRSAAPDVLITATAIPNIDIVALSDLGIKVVYIPSPHNVDEFGRIYKAVGMIFDGLFEGEEKSSRISADIRRTLETSGISLGRFIYVTEGLAVAGGDTFESSVLSYFGTNIAADGSGYMTYDTLSPEEQPDVIVVSDSMNFDDIAADASLGALDAVQAGRMIKIGNSYFESPSGRIVNIIPELNEAGGNVQ